MIDNSQIETTKNEILSCVDVKYKGQVNELLKRFKNGILDAHYKESKHILEVLHVKSKRDNS